MEKIFNQVKEFYKANQATILRTAKACTFGYMAGALTVYISIHRSCEKLRKGVTDFLNA